MDLKHNAHLVRDRFGLRQGQFFATYRMKNLWWELDGEFFGFGDIHPDDVFRIQRVLTEDEMFQGWNEHHGTEHQQTNVPMVRITKYDIVYHADLVAEAGGEQI